MKKLFLAALFSQISQRGAVAAGLMAGLGCLTASQVAQAEPPGFTLNPPINTVGNGWVSCITNNQTGQVTWCCTASTNGQIVCAPRNTAHICMVSSITGVPPYEYIGGTCPVPPQYAGGAGGFAVENGVLVCRPPNSFNSNGVNGGAMPPGGQQQFCQWVANGTGTPIQGTPGGNITPFVPPRPWVYPNMSNMCPASAINTGMCTVPGFAGLGGDVGGAIGGEPGYYIGAGYGAAMGLDFAIVSAGGTLGSFSPMYLTGAYLLPALPYVIIAGELVVLGYLIYQLGDATVDYYDAVHAVDWTTVRPNDGVNIARGRACAAGTTNWAWSSQLTQCKNCCNAQYDDTSSAGAESCRAVCNAAHS